MMIFYNITNELLAKQNDFFERILLLNEKSLGIDSKMLLEDKRKATEDERKKLLEKKVDGSGKADGKWNNSSYLENISCSLLKLCFLRSCM